MVWIKKHAVNKISVIVDVREFKAVGSGVQAVTGFSSWEKMRFVISDAIEKVFNQLLLLFEL